MPRVLAIETSCDETSVAVLSGSAETPVLEAHITLSHAHKTQPYGGIVPEIVAREHLQHLEPLVAQTLAQSQKTLDEDRPRRRHLRARSYGRTRHRRNNRQNNRARKQFPFLAVNHLEGHALSPASPPSPCRLPNNRFCRTESSRVSPTSDIRPPFLRLGKGGGLFGSG